MPYLEVKNATNQSIPSGALTAVTTPTTVTDDGGFIQTSKRIIPFEGQGIIGACVLFDNSNTTGTYRKLCVRVYDVGAEAGGYTDYSIRYEKSIAIVPSAEQRLTRIELVTPSYEFHEGYEVRVYAEHDATGAVNLLNSTVNALVTITQLKQ